MSKMSLKAYFPRKTHDRHFLITNRKNLVGAPCPYKAERKGQGEESGQQLASACE